MVMKRTGASSEIQGAILMLAVTVIIAAVVAAFAFGVAGTVTKGKTVAATATQVENNITVTWYGGSDNQAVVFYNVTLRDRYVQPGTETGFPPEIGNTTTFPSMGTTSLDHVVVSAVFTDGTSQVILDTYV
jgi:FlaG/FlaF family flagellin (archaellin)